MKIQSLRGSRDLYPKERTFQNWLFDIWRKVSKKFGYEEYEGPILEPYDLFAKKSGQELVEEQMYTFQDRSGRRVAIRPEMTPTLARMIAQKKSQIPTPIRWFSIGNFWRYEKPQKGRERDFYQWNVDILGPTSPEADAEIIAVAIEFFQACGLTDSEIGIKINDRKLLEERLDVTGIPKEKNPMVFRAIDKKPKISGGEFEKMLKNLGLSPAQIASLKDALENLDYSDSDRLIELFSTLTDAGYENWVFFDPQIVRGLDYYTSTVFEAYDKDGEFRAILAGGRYDDLVKDLGGKTLPGCGFGAGDVVLKLVLEKFGKLPQFPSSPTQVLVTVFDESQVRESIKISQKLRGEGLNVEVYPEWAKLDKQLKYADQKEILYVLILGPKEVSQGKVTLKDMAAQTQAILTLEEAIKIIKSETNP